MKPIDHGTRLGYNRGCRQDCCRQAVKEYQRWKREGAKGLTPDARRAEDLRLEAIVDALTEPLPPDPLEGWLVSTAPDRTIYAATPAALLEALHGAAGHPCHVFYYGT